MEKEINIIEMINVIFHRKWIVLTSLVLAAVLTFLYSSFLIEPMYTSTGTLYVRNVQEKRGSNVDIAEITASQILVNTYIEILKSDTFTNIVANDVNLGYTSNEIKSMMSLAALNETEILQISVRNTDPYHAALILDSILNNSDMEIQRIVQAGSATVLDPAKVPLHPSSPNVMKNTVLGAFLGAVMSILIIIAIHLLDVTVRDENDLTERYGFPVLGVIPTIKPEGE